ncbi:MAG: methylmalonyl Co-A mutase-associated GTPase MeaB [Bacteroidia bacterium]|nr:methylmalonyl Co-A mutase-associated GTPase MeaB [Bacteroidia bacterium]
MNTSQRICNDILSGDRAALAKAITLMESSLDQHQLLANEVLDLCLPHSGNSIRIAITGVPGVGKSTFIDAFGHYLIDQCHKKVAVLAIDPSSQQTRGSILGDKTRMNRLASSEHAFVRPSPSGTALGGVAAQTRESILLCEAAGYDVVLVETVGVGQSETLVHSMVDLFLLLLLPGAGDELQGIKRGIVEMADAILINKSDTNPKLAKEAENHYKNALQLLHSARRDWKVEVTQVDSISEKNLHKVWKTALHFVDIQKANASFDRTRKEQSAKWFEEQVGNLLLDRFQRDKGLAKLHEELRNKVVEQKTSSRAAATLLVNKVFG